MNAPLLRGLPWAGHGIAFSRRPLTFLANAHDALDADVIRFGYFGKTLYSARGDVATEQFFSSPQLDLKGGFLEIFGGLLPARFLGEEDDDLYAFAKRKAVFNIGAYMDAVRTSTDEVITELGNSGEIDLFDLASALSFRAASRFMIGDTIMSPGFFRRWRELFFATNPVESLGRFQLNMLNPLFWRRQDALFAEMEALLARVIEAKPPTAVGDERSFLDVGLHGIYRERSREKAVGHLYMMFLAAYLNPTLTLGWTLCDLLSRSRFLHGVLLEIGQAHAEHDDPLSRAALDDLGLLKLCVMETLRIRIKAVNVRKVVGGPLPIAGHLIPEGAVICNSPTFAHESATHYEEPRRYNPMRWIGTEELKRSAMTARYMPFGTFSHICPGRRFSHNWIAMTLSSLLSRFDFTIRGAVPTPREGIMPVLADRDGPCIARYERHQRVAL